MGTLMFSVSLLDFFCALAVSLRNHLRIEIGGSRGGGSYRNCVRTVTMQVSNPLGTGLGNPGAATPTREAA